ncbi:MAG: AIR synthase related protein, partial [Gammaproteobacteria bacterium]|nr:AIR synthase related protein [Gammaproteobacteria bacterium]
MKRISLAQGNGGRLMQSLLDEIVFPHIANEYLNTLTDAARVPTSKRTAITTDSFIVTPLRFPGGDIGKLAACGTINDLSVSGARPEYITLSIIVEEGFPVEELENYILSFAKT